VLVMWCCVGGRDVALGTDRGPYMVVMLLLELIVVLICEVQIRLS